MIQVKKNQAQLHACLEKASYMKNTISEYVSEEVQKGRKEIRKLCLYELESHDLPANYQGTQINRCIKISRFREDKEKTSFDNHFYISNLSHKNAENFASLIRGHWQIENSLYWVKDVILKEYESSIRQKNAASTCAILRSMAMNAFRKHGHHSIKNVIIQFANKIEAMIELYRT